MYKPKDNTLINLMTVDWRDINLTFYNIDFTQTQESRPDLVKAGEIIEMKFQWAEYELSEGAGHSHQTEASMWLVWTEFTRALVSRIESYVFPGWRDF